MVAGKHNLIVAATGVHAQSSRSHCIFTITMLTEIDGEVRWSTVRLCDLAGCERARATRNTGARMQESRAINSSLHVLERCLHTLRRRQKARHRADALVPYRESKLTRLLGSGLSGARGEAVSMVVTLNPSPEYAHETKHVLTLAAVAQDIQINNTMLTTTLESSTQDITIETNAEVMRLRSENERLHFELVQAQARNKELLASMEARQQQAADTMRELVDEAKEITRQYYEAQLQALRTKKEEMAEEYESRLAKMSAPSTGDGTPSRYLQGKVAQLMTEIAVLKEKLAAQHLARVCTEKEVEHLRDCIEERDAEKVFKENNSNHHEEVMALSDSEHESDDENDIFNESLEPVFKKENINKSHIVLEDDVKHNISEQIIEERDKSNDTLKNDSLNNTTKDSAYAGGDDDSDFSKKDNHLTVSIVNEKYVDKNDKLNDRNSKITMEEKNNECITEPVEELSKVTNDNGKDNNRITIENRCNDEPINELINVSKENASLKSNKFDSRGTYCVAGELDKIKDVEFKKPSLFRGTYCLKEIDKQPHDKVDEHSDKNSALTKDDKNYISNTKDDEQKFPKKGKETLVSKIIKSIKSQGSDSSLRQFELLEIEANACEETTNDAGDFGEVRFLKEKRNYFYDNSIDSIKNKIHGNVDKVKQIFEDKSKEEKFDVEIHKENKIDSIESVNTKIEEDTSQSKEFFDIKINKEKRTYFDNIGVNVNEPINKKLNDIITENTDERSPSIVKEHVGNDFEPSTIKKLLGESLAKPDFLSSIQKNKIMKKHDSVDIFEGYDSPHLNKTKDIKNDDINYNNIMKSVEKLRLVEEDKIDIKREIKMEAFSSIDIPIIEDNISQEPEIIITSEQIETNVNNTIEEFDKLYNDVSRLRATEFELLVSQEISSVEIKNVETKNVETKKAVEENEVKNEAKEVKQIQFEEDTKYNLRNRDQSKNFTTKRSLRLKRRNHVDEEQEVKFKDIVNLQQEFSDVTMDVPAAKKDVKDIPSPEKCAEEENVPPLLGIQSCPSKSITRSRRKLFTPRAEPLEESLSQTGDSNERIPVPRPSYHRTRVRRKL